MSNQAFRLTKLSMRMHYITLHGCNTAGKLAMAYEGPCKNHRRQSILDPLTIWQFLLNTYIGVLRVQGQMVLSPDTTRLRSTTSLRTCGYTSVIVHIMLVSALRQLHGT